ncbi:MAG: IS30 family transposase [Streptococcaceae bacterium]|jgi:IS30 family transposase|nr:IS30 family transposase [Streptococcaceae bacterium]
MATCERLSVKTATCNSCRIGWKCRLQKRMYLAKEAQINYEKNNRQSRQGINMQPSQLQELDEQLADLLKEKRQPISHITQTNNLPVTSRTLYRWIDQGILSTRNIDLPKKVKYKPRKKHKKVEIFDQRYREGRTYEDFLIYTTFSSSPIVQMDCVEGRKDEKRVLLTLLFTNTNLMLCYLLEQQTQTNVVQALNELESSFPPKIFQHLFPVILTDNGGEFKDSLGIEGAFYEEEKRCKVFYCDPMRSDQKGALEKNHEYIRRFLPKGISFNHLTQEKVAQMTDHINSTTRPQLGGKSPYELAEFMLGKEILDCLGLKKISPHEVQLHPRLLK